MNMGRKAMPGAVKKRRGSAGETLTETLVTMLIVGLSSVLFLTMIGASGRIFRKAEADYKVVYGDITAADVQSVEYTGSVGTITVKGPVGPLPTEISVKWYGSTDNILSYGVE